MRALKRCSLLLLVVAVALLLAGCAWQATLATWCLAALLLFVSACGARSTLLDVDADHGDTDAGDSSDGGDAGQDRRCPDYMSLFDVPELGEWCLPDVDEDGVSDEEDNCPWLDNVDQLDTDDDGIGAACDACGDANGDLISPCEPEMADSDGDGYVDSPWGSCFECESDNCSYIYNPDRADADEDGYGDVCDEFPEVSAIMSPCGMPDLDSDADGIPDMPCGGEMVDPCPTTPSAESGDYDEDDLPDVCDPDGIPPIAFLNRFHRRRVLLERLGRQGVLEPDTVQLALASVA